MYISLSCRSPNVEPHIQLFFCEKIFAIKYRYFKKKHVQAGYSRLRSVDLNCVLFWNQCKVDIFNHQTQKNSIYNLFILWVY